MSDSDGRSGRLLDDEGRLFGLINIIDILVVLLVLAVVVAGVVLLLPSGGGESETRYVTLDLSNQPDFIAEEITPGDTWNPEQRSGSITITDVYRFATGDDQTRVITRARVNGTLLEPNDPAEDAVFEFLGGPLRAGQTYQLVTDEYQVEGAVTRIETSGDTLPVRETEFLLETTLQPATAEEITVGDEFTVSNETYGEVSSLELFPGSDEVDGQYALVGITMDVLERSGSQFIGNTRLTVGQSLSFDGDGYTFSGQISERGTSEITTESRPFVIQTEVPTTVADNIQSGDAFTLRDNAIVSVESVTVYPTANPDVRRVVLGVSAKTRLDNNALFFGNRQLRVGSSLPIVNDKYDITGAIIRRGSTTEPGAQTSRTVTVLLENISPERADLIESGMTEQTRSGITAEVTRVRSEPAQVILESEDGNIYQREHPENKDLELRVELSVRELDSGTLRFRGDTLRAGETLALELGRVTIQGDVIDFE